MIKSMSNSKQTVNSKTEANKNKMNKEQKEEKQMN